MAMTDIRDHLPQEGADTVRPTTVASRVPVNWVVFGVAAALSVLTILEPVVFSAPPAQAQSGGAIRSIRVEGNKRVEPEAVQTYLRFHVGDAYDPAKVDQSIKSLFSTGLFSDVRIDRDGAGVVVTVVENPVVNQVAFEGNREVDKATLTAEVQLKPRSIFTRAKAQADVQRILDIYRRQGRFGASGAHSTPCSSNTTRQAASLRSKLQLALAGLVEGRRCTGRPSVRVMRIVRADSPPLCASADSAGARKRSPARSLTCSISFR